MGGALNVKNPEDARADLESLLDKEEKEEEHRDELEQTRRRMERTEARGVGRMHLVVNYPRAGVDEERVPFVRLPMGEATDVLDQIDEIREEEGTREFAEFLSSTLEEYSLDPDKDADHWDAELTMGDALGLVRNVAFGGSPPGK